MPRIEPTLVRYAVIGDAVDIASLIGELGYSVTAQSVLDRLTQLSSKETDKVLVADHAGKIGGFLSFHLIPLIHVDGNLGRITALAVNSSFRRCGIGGELVAAAESRKSFASVVSLSSGSSRLS
jgi:N-acetylglutamate synthase-like GNAT family acetyltransferase